MVPSASQRATFGSIRRKLQKNSRSPGDKDSDALSELRSRLAVRFLIKKSRRFGVPRSGLPRSLHERETDEKKTSSTRLKTNPECLLYLGLAPNTNGPQNYEEKRNGQPRCQRADFQFAKPRVYECDYCSKIFFHRLPYRRHTIWHIRKIHLCPKCNQGFRSKHARRIHQACCRR